MAARIDVEDVVGGGDHRQLGALGERVDGEAGVDQRVGGGWRLECRDLWSGAPNIRLRRGARRAVASVSPRRARGTAGYAARGPVRRAIWHRHSRRARRRRASCRQTSRASATPAPRPRGSAHARRGIGRPAGHRRSRRSDPRRCSCESGCRTPTPRSCSPRPCRAARSRHRCWSPSRNRDRRSRRPACRRAARRRATPRPMARARCATG